MNVLNKGIFITIEGIDGSGKTTFAKQLNEFFLLKKFPSILTKEPSETSIGRQLRILLQESRHCNKSEYLLFAADRAQHFYETVIPNIKNNRIVISDRCADSSLAYQAYVGGLEVDMVNQINLWAMSGLQPDITIYLKIDPEIALGRINKRNETISKFENLANLNKVSAAFDKIFENRKNIITLDASGTLDCVLNKAIQELISRKIILNEL